MVNVLQNAAPLRQVHREIQFTDDCYAGRLDLNRFRELTGDVRIIFNEAVLNQAGVTRDEAVEHYRVMRACPADQRLGHIANNVTYRASAAFLWNLCHIAAKNPAAIGRQIELFPQAQLAAPSPHAENLRKMQARLQTTHTSGPEAAHVIPYEGSEAQQRGYFPGAEHSERSYTVNVPGDGNCVLYAYLNAAALASPKANFVADLTQVLTLEDQQRLHQFHPGFYQGYLWHFQQLQGKSWHDIQNNRELLHSAVFLMRAVIVKNNIAKNPSMAYSQLQYLGFPVLPGQAREGSFLDNSDVQCFSEVLGVTIDVITIGGVPGGPRVPRLPPQRRPLIPGQTCSFLLYTDVHAVLRLTLPEPTEQRR